MPALSSPPRGRFVWHELMTTDPDAAARFYGTVIGWKTETFPTMPDYRLWTLPDSPPMGGLQKLPEEARQMGAPPHWLPYIAVPSVDACVLQATGLGARTYLAGMDIPDVGRIAVLADPQGATFAVYTPSMPGEGSDAAAIGDFSWHELVTTDYKAAWSFYQALFGWVHSRTMDMGPGLGDYFIFKRTKGGQDIGGMFNKPAAMPAPPHWLSYTRVADADKAVATAKARGAQILHGPADVPGGSRIASMMDPQGALFAVHAVAAATSAPKAKARRAKKKTAARKTAARSSARKAPAKKKTAAAKKKPAGKGAARKAAAKKALKRAGAAVKKAAGKARAAVKKAAATVRSRIKKRK